MNEEKVELLVNFLKINNFNFSFNAVEYTNFGKEIHNFSDYNELKDFLDRNHFAKFEGIKIYS